MTMYFGLWPGRGRGGPALLIMQPLNGHQGRLPSPQSKSLSHQMVTPGVGSHARVPAGPVSNCINLYGFPASLNLSFLGIGI